MSTIVVYEKVGNLMGPEGPEGPQGPAGERGADGAQGERGLPALEAVPTQEGLATYITATDSIVRAAVDRAISEHDILRYPIEKFLATDTEKTRWRLGQYQDGTYRIDVIMQRAHDALYLLSGGVDGDPAQNGDGRTRVLEFPHGRFKMDVAVRPGFNGRVGAVGAGKDRTVFVLNTSNQFWAPEGDPNEGGWVEGVNPFYQNLFFADFTVDGYAHTPYDGATGWGGGNKKVFSLGHVRNSRFERVKTVGTWSTSIGIDYNDGNLFIDCEAIDCGRGRYTAAEGERIGSGSGFGLGAGTFAAEMTILIGCVAKNCGANGFFFEQLNRPEAVHKSIGFMVLNGWAEGNNIGISDAGGSGTIVQGMTLINNRRAGFRVGGTQPNYEGGREGLLTGNTITGNGIGVEFDNTCEGGYRVAGNTIKDNTVGVMWEDILWPGRRLTVQGNNFIHNKAAGVCLRSRGQVAEASIIDNEFDGNGHDADAALSMVQLGASPRAIIPGDIVVDSDTYKLTIRDNRHARGEGWSIVWAPNHTHTKRRVRGNDTEDQSRNAATPSSVTFIGGSVDTIDQNPATAAVTNLCVMPTPVTSNGGANEWTASGSSAQREVVSGSYWGRSFLRVTTTAGIPEATAGGAATTVTAGQIYRATVHVKGPVGSRVRPGVWENGTFVPGLPVPATGQVQEVTIVHTVSSGVTSLRPGARGDQLDTGSTVEFHGAQLTAGTAAYPFIAGFRPGCVWAGAEDASTSSRSLSIIVNECPSPLGNDMTLWTNDGNRANMSVQPGGFYGVGQIEVAASTGFPNPTPLSPFVSALPGQVWTGSILAKGRPGDRLTLILAESSNRIRGMQIRATGEWQELWITRKLGSGTQALRVGVKANSSDTLGGTTLAGTVAVDGAMLIRGSALPHRIIGGASPAVVADGDEWTGPAYRSMSARHLTTGLAV